VYYYFQDTSKKRKNNVVRHFQESIYKGNEEGREENTAFHDLHPKK